MAKTAKLAEIRGKQSELKSNSVALVHNNEDYKAVGKEYDAVVAYLDKLKPECETKVLSCVEKNLCCKLCASYRMPYTYGERT